MRRWSRTPSISWPAGHSGSRRIITLNLRTQSPYRLSIDRCDLIFISQTLPSQRGRPGGCASISNLLSRPFPRCANLFRSATHYSAIPSQATAPALPNPGQSYPPIPCLAMPHGRDPTQRSHRCFHFPFAGLCLTRLLALHLASSSGSSVPSQTTFLCCSDQPTMWIYPMLLSSRQE